MAARWDVEPAGLAVELLETRHVRAAFRTMPVKTDKKDARGIAQLMRLGWFRPVWCKSLAAQEVRAVLTARKLLQGKVHDVEMSLRGILRGFGLKVGATTPRYFAARVQALAQGHPTLEGIVEALLKAREVMRRWNCAPSNGRVQAMAREDHRPARTPYDNAGCWRGRGCPHLRCGRDRRGGPVPVFAAWSQTHFGLTPRKYQSGETDYTGRISKIGEDASVRTALYKAAHRILTPPVAGSTV